MDNLLFLTSKDLTGTIYFTDMATTDNVTNFQTITTYYFFIQGQILSLTAHNSNHFHSNHFFLQHLGRQGH